MHTSNSGHGTHTHTPIHTHLHTHAHTYTHTYVHTLFNRKGVVHLRVWRALFSRLAKFTG